VYYHSWKVESMTVCGRVNGVEQHGCHGCGAYGDVCARRGVYSGGCLCRLCSVYELGRGVVDHTTVIRVFLYPSSPAQNMVSRLS
jgi:hypothetical protein